MASLQEEAGVKEKRALLANRRQKNREARGGGEKLASLAPEDKRGRRVERGRIGARQWNCRERYWNGAGMLIM